MVEHSTQDPEIMGSSPAPVADTEGRENDAQ